MSVALIVLWHVYSATAMCIEEVQELDMSFLQTATTVNLSEVHVMKASKPGSSAADVSGVETNAAGDLTTFLTGLMTNSAMIAACVVAFIVLKSRYPKMFAYNSISGKVPDTPADDNFSWVSSSEKKVHEEHRKYAGLDHAMLLEFTMMCKRILMKIGLPMLLIMSPLNYLFGHGSAEQTGDNLSRIAMGNVAISHPWLYYIYGPITIAVVWIVRRETFTSMRRFCESRFIWMKHLKNPQASTVMVEGIPDEYQSDEKVKEYFSRMFSKDSIKAVHVAKHISQLETVYAELRDAMMNLAKAEQEWENAGREAENRPQIKSMMSPMGGGAEDAIEYWTKQRDIKQKEAAEYRENFIKDAEAGVGGVNGHCGFVTFNDVRDARVAMNVKFSKDRNSWQVTLPPAPSAVIWSDMKVNVDLRSGKRLLGYGLVFGLYVAFTPFCLFVTNLATAVNLGPFQSLWEAYAPTLGLLIFLSFAPTVLINIFSLLFNFKSEVKNQLELQNWYFWFMVFFVIGVTVVGQDFVNFVEQVAKQPTQLPMVLAEKMPTSTHYYLNFLVLQWVTHAMNLTRYMQVTKFVGFSKIWSEDDARALAEPEDQDYYGMGSRSARFTINMLIAIIFGTLSPLMYLLAWINFYLCRVIYGYLVVYAETRKEDSGGYFFIAQLHHIYAGLFFYCLLMIGLFSARAPNYVPTGFAVVAFIYAFVSYRAFIHDFEWETLPWEEIAQNQEGKDFQPEDSGETYIQAELLEELPTTKLS
ncbi:CSC1-like protein At4g02900 [Durusdinium trenchii]|uniref:CSC1-like protein At4g02900 n=1 Tax=Durusdinium trenchii TaxID=1381693 RepID=A0ABP0R136_9DINO